MKNKQQTLRELIMVENSRRNTDLIADLVFHKPEVFGELMNIYFLNEEPVSRRAVWIVDTVTEKMPHLLEPFIDRIILKLSEFQHDGLKRNTLRMLSRTNISILQSGLLMKICFEWLVSKSESVAVKVYSMDILYLISIKETDIKKELAESIEWRMQEESAGFKGHAVKILKKLHRELI
jgi:hypothetical protein